MITKNILTQKSDFLWEIPKNYRAEMKVPAQVFASSQMLDEILKDNSLGQLINVATLPGIQKVALAMPDIHEGYGFPIGGVAAFLYQGGIISPGGIGYDINCGVRLLKSNLDFKEVKPRLANLSEALYRTVPSGVGRGSKFKVTFKEMDQILEKGSEWAIESGFGEKKDLSRTESGGRLNQARANAVSLQAKKRGLDQSGTLGAGNHFLEVDYIEEIFDQEVAKAFGLKPNQAVVLIHCGSRGLGHQVATDYVRVMLSVMAKYNIAVPDRELACAPLSSHEGKEYFSAMAAAANFAWANRQVITHWVRRVWQKFFKKETLELLYDVAHNIAKIESHNINGAQKKLIVHRKGATRAFGPNHLEIAPEFQATGQPVIVPGSMGTASYVMVGTKENLDLSFGSCCHGAGRRMARGEARRTLHGQNIKEELKQKGITILTGSMAGLAEEAPEAYKNIDEIVNVIATAGLARKVARLKPMAVIKG